MALLNIILHHADQPCLQRASYNCCARNVDKRSRARKNKNMPRHLLSAFLSLQQSRQEQHEEEAAANFYSFARVAAASAAVCAVRTGFAATRYAAAAVTAAAHAPAVLLAATVAAVLLAAALRAAGTLRARAPSDTAAAVLAIPAAPNAAAVVTAAVTATAPIAMGLEIWEKWNQSLLSSATYQTLRRAAKASFQSAGAAIHLHLAPWTLGTRAPRPTAPRKYERKRKIEKSYHKQQ